MSMNELGNFLKELRGKRSLREVANLTNLSHTYIADVENGFRRGTNKPIKPSPETLKKLSEAYNYSYFDLMEKAGYLDDLTESEKQPLSIEKELDLKLRDAFSKIQTLIEQNIIKYEQFYDALGNVILDQKVNITLSITYSESNFEAIRSKILQSDNVFFKYSILEVSESIIEKGKSIKPTGMSFYNGGDDLTEDEIAVMESALMAYREQKKKLMEQMKKNN